jgi:hypothetical protein
MRPDTLKQQQELIGNALKQIGIGITSLVEVKKLASKRKNEQMGLHQTESFCISKKQSLYSRHCPQNGRYTYQIIMR